MGFFMNFINTLRLPSGRVARKENFVILANLSVNCDCISTTFQTSSTWSPTVLPWSSVSGGKRSGSNPEAAFGLQNIL